MFGLRAAICATALTSGIVFGVLGTRALLSGDKAADAPRAGTPVQAIAARAQRGDARAEVLLGDRYYAGRGVARDARTAASWYRLAAAQGDPDALSMLAGMYAVGFGGVPRAPKMAARLLQIAAQRGSSRARMLLALRRSMASGVTTTSSTRP